MEQDYTKKQDKEGSRENSGFLGRIYEKSGLKKLAYGAMIPIMATGFALGSYDTSKAGDLENSLKKETNIETHLEKSDYDGLSYVQALNNAEYETSESTNVYEIPGDKTWDYKGEPENWETKKKQSKDWISINNKTLSQENLEKAQETLDTAYNEGRLTQKYTIQEDSSPQIAAGIEGSEEGKYFQWNITDSDGLEGTRVRILNPNGSALENYVSDNSKGKMKLDKKDFLKQNGVYAIEVLAMDKKGNKASYGDLIETYDVEQGKKDKQIISGVIKPSKTGDIQEPPRIGGIQEENLKPEREPIINGIIEIQKTGELERPPTVGDIENTSDVEQTHYSNEKGLIIDVNENIFKNKTKGDSIRLEGIIRQTPEGFNRNDLNKTWFLYQTNEQGEMTSVNTSKEGEEFRIPQSGNWNGKYIVNGDFDNNGGINPQTEQEIKRFNFNVEEESKRNAYENINLRAHFNEDDFENLEKGDGVKLEGKVRGVPRGLNIQDNLKEEFEYSIINKGVNKTQENNSEVTFNQTGDVLLSYNIEADINQDGVIQENEKDSKTIGFNVGKKGTRIENAYTGAQIKKALDWFAGQGILYKEAAKKRDSMWNNETGKVEIKNIGDRFDDNGYKEFADEITSPRGLGYHPIEETKEIGNNTTNAGKELVHFLTGGFYGESDTLKNINKKNNQKSNQFISWGTSPFRFAKNLVLDNAVDIIDIPLAGLGDKSSKVIGNGLKSTMYTADDIVDIGGAGITRIPAGLEKAILKGNSPVSDTIYKGIALPTDYLRNTLTFESVNNANFSPEGHDKGVLTIAEILAIYYSAKDSYDNYEKDSSSSSSDGTGGETRPNIPNVTNPSNNPGQGPSGTIPPVIPGTQ